MGKGGVRPSKPGGQNGIGRCPVCATRDVELLHVSSYGPMCSACLKTLAQRGY